MKNKSKVCGVAIVGLGLLLLRPALGQESPATSTNKPAPKVVIYRAAKGSAAAARVTGGSRGSGDASVNLSLLLPDRDGLTIQEQPSLFWYQSKPSAAKFELTLLEANQAKPLLQIKADHADKTGIQRVRLADHGVRLATGVEYQWVIALVPDPENRSRDLVASGFIQRIDPPPGLKEAVASAPPDSLPASYAEAGIWLDALSSLADQIDAQPENQALREQRSGLLRQVGLDKAAGAEAAAPAK